LTLARRLTDPRHFRLKRINKGCEIGVEMGRYSRLKKFVIDRGSRLVSKGDIRTLAISPCSREGFCRPVAGSR
jgi:hypothetical protein